MKESDELSGRHKLAAGIVLYNPAWMSISKLVVSLASDVDAIFFFANSAIDDFQAENLRVAAGQTPVVILGTGVNAGLGVAYNAFVAEASSREYGFLLLLDQDSYPKEGMASQLASLHARLSAAGERPAVMGPQPTEPDGTLMRISRDRRRASVLNMPVTRVNFAISSGSLIDLTKAEAVGPFREEYFVDAIDIEWCFRAEARGFSIWIGDGVLMEHRLGSGLIRLPFGLLLVEQPSWRIYTYLRNQLALMRLRHVPLRYKTRIVLTLPLRIFVHLLRSSFSREMRQAIMFGLRDGAQGSFGAAARDRAIGHQSRRPQNSCGAAGEKDQKRDSPFQAEKQRQDTAKSPASRRDTHD